MSEAQIIALARRFAEERGWTWYEPVVVRARQWKNLASFQVDTHAGSRGANIRMILAAADGRLLHAAYLPR